MVCRSLGQQLRPRIVLLGAPTEDGARLAGTMHGPAAIRAAGLPEMLRQTGLQVDDRGNLTENGRVEARTVRLGGCARNASRVALWTRRLSDASYALMREVAVPIFLGGDHSLSIGTVNGVARHCADVGQTLSLLWLDAHADFNTPATSPSGNMHGMALAALCGEAGLESIFGEQPRATVDPRNVHVFGMRSVDIGEAELVGKRGVNVYGMRQLRELSVRRAMGHVLDTVARRGGVLHVSFDTDFLDPSIAPGVGTKVPGGATIGEARVIMDMLHRSGLVVSLDIAELNPMFDEVGKSARVVAELAAGLFGCRIAADQQAARLEAFHGRTGT